MDKQEMHGLFQRLRRRFDRRPPVALYIYGRRAIPATGFSPGELKEAGVSEQDAARLGLKVDPERMSSLGTNVESLRSFIARL
jgi:ribosomal protein L13E